MWCRGCHRSSCELCWCDDSEAEPTHISNVLAVSCQSCLSCLSCLSWLSWILCGLCVGVAFQLTMQRMPLKISKSRASQAVDFICYDCFDNVAASFDAHLLRSLEHRNITHTQRYSIGIRCGFGSELLSLNESVCVCVL